MLLTLAVFAMLASSPADHAITNAPRATMMRGTAHEDDPTIKSRAMKPLTACGRLRQRDTTYVLQKDVSSPGTCFSIEEDNITLDLNGHTVTYATTDQTKPTFGVLAADCWYKDIAGNPCDGGHKHAVVMNGKIVQGSTAAPMSHALRFGQANHLTGITLHDLDITVSAPDSIGIYSEYLPGGSNVYRNTIHNHVTVITNRHQFRGTSIKLDEEREAKLPDLIHDNFIIGGPHTGIRSDNSAGTKIYGNDISQDANYTNGFCIDAAGTRMEIFGNKCHPVHGRGIHANATGVKIYDNVIETIDSDKNQEYQGCEINGTYGIQVESDGRQLGNIRVYHNRVKVHAAECPASAMRLTDLKDTSVQINDNTFVAVQDSLGGRLSTQPARGFSVSNVAGDHVSFTHNLVQADTAIFSMDWDGGSAIKLEDNTFKAGAHGTATLLAEFGNGTAPSQENVFIDNEVQGFTPSAKFGEYTGASWFVIASSLIVHINDQTGKPVAGARVQSADAAAHTNSAVSDANGDATISLPMARFQSKQEPAKYTSHSVTITSEACKADRFILPQPGPKKISRTLACHLGG